MSDELWKLKTQFSIFSLHNSVFNGISIIKPTLRVPRSESSRNFFFSTRFGEFGFFFFFFFFFFSLSRWVWFGLLHLFFFFFFFHWLRWVWVSRFFFFFPRFSEFGYWGLKETKEKKNVKATPSYRYGAYKQLKNLSDDKLSDGAKRVRCRELRYFKWWVMSDENWARSDEW